MASRLIKDLHPQFQELVTKLLAITNPKLGEYEAYITDGFRSFAEQTELYAKGRTAPGKIVTNAKAGQSPHNYGLAVDIAFRKGGKGLFYDVEPYKKLYDEARKLGFELGADWTGFQDKPHFEHPQWEKIANKNGDPMPSTKYKGYVLTDLESMKAAVDVLVEVQNGLFIRKTDLEPKIEEEVVRRTRDLNILLENERKNVSKENKRFEELWDLILKYTPAQMVTRYDDGKLKVYFERYTEIDDKAERVDEVKRELELKYQTEIETLRGEVKRLQDDIIELGDRASKLAEQLVEVKQEKERISRIAVVIDSFLQIASKIRFTPKKKDGKK